MSHLFRLRIAFLITMTLVCLPRDVTRVGAQKIGKPKPTPSPVPDKSKVPANPAASSPKIRMRPTPTPSKPDSSLPAAHQDVVLAFKAISRRDSEPKPGEAVRYLLVVGPAITNDTIRQLIKLVEINQDGRAGLIAIALLSKDHQQYNAIVSGVGNSSYLGLINTYPHPERIDATFFVGFSNDGSSPRGSQITERFSNPRLDVLVERALTEWGDVYVFASPGLWTPIDREAIKTVAQSAKKIVWAGDKNGDDVTDFFASVRSRNQQKGRID